MEKYQILQNMPLLKNSSEETLRVIAADTYHKKYQKNDIVITPDSAIHKIAIVANKGRMKICTINQKTGEEYIAYILTFGDFFNVTTLIDGKKDQLEAIAIDDLDILFCNIDIARGWITRFDDFNKMLLGYTSERLRMVQTFNSDKTFYSIEIRLARLIFDNIISDDNPLNLINDLSHKELAKMLGTSRAVVNRNLQKLRKDNLIDIKRKKILIKDYNEMNEYIQENSYS